MALTREQENLILSIGEDKETEKTATEQRAKLTRDLAKKREELEITRLQKEIDRLNAPDVDENNYFKQMLELQKQTSESQLNAQKEHFAQMLEMSRQQNDLKLEIEKLKIGENSDDLTETLVSELIPYLPQILNNRTAQKSAKSVTSFSSPSDKPQEERGLAESMRIPTAAETEEATKAIKEGRLTFEDFCEGAKKSFPEIFNKLTPEQIKAEYDKLKNS